MSTFLAKKVITWDGYIGVWNVCGQPRLSYANYASRVKFHDLLDLITLDAIALTHLAIE